MGQNVSEPGGTPPRIVASTYELGEKIGSGGGGVVYLGRHLRLDKPVVLKADKRTLSAAPEVLRREVDALKGLSHTYIPQVYDFVVEDDTVYTVMDYIEGESLDKPLKRGERFAQPQVIAWACQLLEALDYLHSRPPHGILHADVKPANIMLTPENDIRLIDFNIALALGEEGAVSVGRSMGYASPEHYGQDFSGRSGPAALHSTVAASSRASGSAGSGGTVMLDVRSDIYSVGATLYHLLTGEKPNADARNVRPIPPQEASPAVAAIVRRAMDPDPAKRYQTAAEMLDAFRQLHARDPRVLRLKRRTTVTAAVLAAALLAGGICAFTGMGLRRQAEEAARLEAEAAQAAEEAARLEAEAAEEAQRQAKEALAAVTAAESALADGDAAGAASLALTALDYDTDYNSRARKALAGALGVYDLAGGFKASRTIELPSEAQKVAISPNGRWVAAATDKKVSVYAAAGGELMATLDKAPSALADIVFLDDKTLLYAGDTALKAYDVPGQRELWYGYPATGIALSGDGSVAAAVYRDETHATLYDTATGAVLRTVDFNGKKQRVLSGDIAFDQGGDLFALNRDGTMLAVSFDGGELIVYDLRNGLDIQLRTASDFVLFEGGFHDRWFAYSATKSGGNGSLMSIVDMAALTEEVFYQKSTPFHVRADEDGILIFMGHTLVRMDTGTWVDYSVAYSEGAGIADFAKGEAYTLTVLEDGSFAFFDAAATLVSAFTPSGPVTMAAMAGGTAAVAGTDSATLRLLELEEHTGEKIFTYDRRIPHTEARISADGRTVMLFNAEKFILLPMEGEGKPIAEVELPNSGDVWDTQFQRDMTGSYLEVMYRSGLVRSYSAMDGRVLSERLEDPPDLSRQEYYTDDYRIEAPFHGTPIVYDKDSGEKVAELEPDSYLAYVTQLDGYIVTEYYTADGARYGLLLSKDLEVLAELPGLCDITLDGTLIFDDMRGTLRQSPIYTVSELTALAGS